MGFEKIRTRSLTDLFVEQIETLIFSGELNIGDRLPNSRELSETLGVSRPVISAGLVELEKMGFIEVKPRQGAYVTDYRRNGTVETLTAIMRYNGGSLRDHEVLSLLDVREALEVLCVRQVIDKAAEEELRQLEPIIFRIASESDPLTAAEAVFTFHHELSMLSRNELLPLLYYSFKTQSVHLWEIGFRVNGNEPMFRFKQNLLSAIQERRTDLAVARVEEEISYARKFFQ